MLVNKTNFIIKGIACAMPDNQIVVEDLIKDKYSAAELSKILSMVGVNTLYQAKKDQTTADLCLVAAEKLIADLGWSKNEIGALIFVSQTPDYITPATSFLLHNKLGLPNDCAVFDVNFGCSGFINGLLMAANFINKDACEKVLLMVGDTIRKSVSLQDSSVSIILGDGVSVTALEYCDNPTKTTIAVFSDGKGADKIIIPAGGFRQPKNKNTSSVIEDKDGNKRSAENIYMNGIEIFMFSIRVVPSIIHQIIRQHGWEISDVDKVLLHQANLFMLKSIAKKAHLPFDLFPTNIDKFGNVSGASIPLLICDTLKDEINNGTLKTVMVGFGVGLSWGAVAMELKNVYCSEIMFV